MTQRQLPRRPQATSNKGGNLTSRPELPVVMRNPSSGIVPLVVVLVLIMIVVGGFINSGGTLLPGRGVASVYASQYDIRNIDLTPTTRKTRAVWAIAGQVFNASGNQIDGPRLQIQLVRDSDDSVLAEGTLDLSSQQLAPGDSTALAYQLETAAGEKARAVITPRLPQEGAYDRP